MAFSLMLCNSFVQKVKSPAEKNPSVMGSTSHVNACEDQNTSSQKYLSVYGFM
jgi:hypothetical protein